MGARTVVVKILTSARSCVYVPKGAEETTDRAFCIERDDIAQMQKAGRTLVHLSSCLIYHFTWAVANTHVVLTYVDAAILFVFHIRIGHEVNTTHEHEVLTGETSNGNGMLKKLKKLPLAFKFIRDSIYTRIITQNLLRISRRSPFTKSDSRGVNISRMCELT